MTTLPSPPLLSSLAKQRKNVSVYILKMTGAKASQDLYYPTNSFSNPVCLIYRSSCLSVNNILTWVRFSAISAVISVSPKETTQVNWVLILDQALSKTNGFKNISSFSPKHPLRPGEGVHKNPASQWSQVRARAISEVTIIWYSSQKGESWGLRRFFNQGHRDGGWWGLDLTPFLLAWKPAKHLTVLVYTSRPRNRKSH